MGAWLAQVHILSLPTAAVIVIVVTDSPCASQPASQTEPVRSPNQQKAGCG